MAKIASAGVVSRRKDRENFYPKVTNIPEGQPYPIPTDYQEGNTENTENARLDIQEGLSTPPLSAPQLQGAALTVNPAVQAPPAPQLQGAAPTVNPAVQAPPATLPPPAPQLQGAAPVVNPATLPPTAGNTVVLPVAQLQREAVLAPPVVAVTLAQPVVA